MQIDIFFIVKIDLNVVRHDKFYAEFDIESDPQNLSPQYLDPTTKLHYLGLM